ncbi:MAG: type IV pilus biogenesis/stability protein PilW [Acidiferrobacteraceae bacterium]|nr:type IV pilus biogenesis/stability protein PilW [Acidiferrobacteraceae bacterium]
MIRLLTLFSALLFLAGCAISPENSNTWEDHERVRVHTQLAYQYLERGMLGPAKDEAEFALDLGPTDSNANHVMALIESRLGNIGKAGSLFVKSLEIDPQNWMAQNSYGSFLCGEGMWAEGIFQYNSAMENPFNAEADRSVLGLGICHAGLGDFVNAELYLKRALQENPNLKTGLYHMAMLSYTQGRYMSARAFIERYLEDGSTSPEILLLAVNNEIRLDSYQLARSYAGLLESIFPLSPETQVAAEIMTKAKDG